MLHVQPGASRAAIVGVHADRLKVSVTKKAVDGAANQGVQELLAETFKISKSSVKIIAGEKAKQKTVLLQGDKNSLVKRLQEILSKHQTESQS